MREKGLKVGKILKLGVLVLTIIQQKIPKSCKFITKNRAKRGYFCKFNTILIQ